MNKILYIIIFMFFTASSFAQTVTPITFLNESQELQTKIFHFRTNKGDSLKINIQTDIKNEKKAKYYKLKNVRLYRENADQDFQYIIDKNDVSKIDENIVVPSDGIYTLIINRGGLKKFNTNLFFQRIPESEASAVVKQKAFLVSIPDTIHTYKSDSVTCDYVRTSTPNIKKERTLDYNEDQIFKDISYALRVDNKFVVPIQFPLEIVTNYKSAKSVKWGFFLTVSDEVYKALQKKVGQVATAAISAGAGKVMSGKVDEATGAVNKNTIQKGYEVFDKASTANAVAGITGDVGDQTNSKPVSVSSNVVKTVTGFTGLTETAGNAIGSLMPKIDDEIIYQLLSAQEYQKYLRKEPYTAIQKGKGSFVKGEFSINNPNDIYYLIIENERKTSGGVTGALEAIGKTILSQYVYTNLKVFVEREVQNSYDKGYYENSFKPIKNVQWTHTEKVNYSHKVLFENQIKPYYKKLNSQNIY